jgi:hypothetical protein
MCTISLGRDYVKLKESYDLEIDGLQVGKTCDSEKKVEP